MVNKDGYVDEQIAQAFYGWTFILNLGSKVCTSLVHAKAIYIEEGMEVGDNLATHLSGSKVFLPKGSIIRASLAGAKAVFIEEGMEVDDTLRNHNYSTFSGSVVSVKR